MKKIVLSLILILFAVSLHAENFQSNKKQKEKEGALIEIMSPGTKWKCTTTSTTTTVHNDDGSYDIYTVTSTECHPYAY